MIYYFPKCMLKVGLYEIIKLDSNIKRGIGIVVAAIRVTGGLTFSLTSQLQSAHVENLIAVSTTAEIDNLLALI
jgi:hypothetical protein